MSVTWTTGALQAAFYEKPSIVLARNIYNEFLPSVFQINNLEELPDTIRIALKTRVNLTDLNRFVNYTVPPASRGTGKNAVRISFGPLVNDISKIEEGIIKVSKILKQDN